ncbi:YbaK/EbsC family protein [Sneathiella chinensis]|uniref:Aminoacyl-tRNA deacylase n=1 Tax=Sneathiella chinensis TaxID=349750 RepID=A0ABQ5U7F8_9PROT|nr:YbaK/EbsC family protein [Sneathiella chinensis]GLQ07356.1 aminoacyl-tRNA deacylase [Sneathiella chinensis]
MSGLLERPSVRQVIETLQAAGIEGRVRALESTARSAEDAASSIGCNVGAIVKTLVFMAGDQLLVALVAGDKRCDTKALRAHLGGSGKIRPAPADLVKEETGFSIGGVAPVGMKRQLPVFLDESLARFDRIYAAAGHPHCIFQTSLTELEALTGGHTARDISH